jgi:hypothetical protein
LDAPPDSYYPSAGLFRWFFISHIGFILVPLR